LFKKLVIYLIIIAISGCSVFNKQSNFGIDDKDKTNTEFLRSSNITNNSFYIQKAEVEVDTEVEKNSFLASVKFCKPDSFLISIRTKTGIEGVRIFMTKDTVLINDRINRKLYFGSGNDIKKKFGYSFKLLPVLFGAFVLNNDKLNEIKNCEEEVYKVSSKIEDYSLKYSIDCRSDRLTSLEIYSELETKPVLISFYETKKYEHVYYYSRVLLNDLKGFNSLKIRIKKIEAPYEEFIEFVPGKNYERVRIR